MIIILRAGNFPITEWQPDHLIIIFPQFRPFPPALMVDRQRNILGIPVFVIVTDCAVYMMPFQQFCIDVDTVQHKQDSRSDIA
jgi:hypothetical protein